MCLLCHKVNIEHQKPSRLLQHLEIPGCKWEIIYMDFAMGLPKTSVGFDVIWVILNQLMNQFIFYILRQHILG